MAPGAAAPPSAALAVARGAATPRIVAAPAWRAVDFVSDLHLCETMPRTLAAFDLYLARTSADAVFILGDLFEVWVGDDVRVRTFERRCVEMLAQASRRLDLYWIAGNRDFLLGEAMLADGGMRALADPTRLDAFGQRVLLSHGDALCLDDEPYQRFRREVRDAAWQREFLLRPLAERETIARGLRDASESRRDAGVAIEDWGDVDEAEALRWLQAADATDLVHGHTHRPADHALAPGRWRRVLSDWDRDHARRAEALRLDGAGWRRLPPQDA